MRQRQTKIQLWLNDEEAAALKAKAEAVGLSKSALLRAFINGYRPREKPDDRFYDYMRELRAIGNNLNQLRAKANALGYIDTPMLNEEAERWKQFRAEVQDVFLLPEKDNRKWR